MLSMSLTSFADHSRSATAKARGHRRISSTGATTFSAHSAASPPSRLASFAGSGTTGGMPFGTASRRVPSIG